MALTQIKTSGIADGTDGQIITYDADGKATTVGPGTDGQVLTSTGAGSPPAFETPAAGVGGATGVDFNDDVMIRLGTGNDAELDYDGTANQLLLKTSTSGSHITLDAKNYAEIKIDGSQILLFSPTYGLQASKDLTILGPDGSTGAKIVLSEDHGLVNNEATIQASNAMTSDVQITLPAANPASNGLSLTSTTAGVTSWATPAIPDNSVSGDKIALGSDASGDIMYNNGTDYVRLAKGTDDQVLTLASGVPSWAAAGGGAVSRYFVDTNTDESTTNHTNDPQRIGSGNGFELSFTPPSTDAHYIIHWQIYIDESDDGGQWGLQPKYSTDDRGSWHDLGIYHPWYGEYRHTDDPNRRYMYNVWREWHPNTTNECFISMWIGINGTEDADITTGGSSSTNRMYAFEIPDASNANGW